MNTGFEKGASSGDKASVLDIEKHPGAKKLLRRCQDLFAEIDNLYILIDSLINGESTDL